MELCSLLPSKERDEKIQELEALLQEARQQPMAHQQPGSELSLRRSQRLAASTSTQQLQEVKAKLDQCRAELNTTTEGEKGERARPLNSAQGRTVLQTSTFKEPTWSYVPNHSL